MNKRIWKECKQKLEQKRDELQSMKQIAYHQSLEEQVGELSSYDQHPGDMGTELYKRERDMALEEHKKQELIRVEKALDKIEKGNYGLCDICGKEIHQDRLIAIPDTAYCIEHADEI